MEAKMDNPFYKEIVYKVRGMRVVSWLVGIACLLTCALLGVGGYILLTGLNQTDNTPHLSETITVIEEIKNPEIVPHHPKMVHATAKQMETLPVVNLQESSDVIQRSEPGLEELIVEDDNNDSKHFLVEAIKLFQNYITQFDTSSNRRSKRSINFGIKSYLPYLSYTTFGKFLYDKLVSVTEEKIQGRSMQGRKLYGDNEAQFLDGHYYSSHKSAQKVEKYPNEVATKVEKINKNHYEPMVNQVPLSFVSEILKTLLKLMKEFLMKDHVMECLWYMFCKDVNEQAKFNNLYGMLARVNSVGLKVLSEKELRHTDTIGQVFRAVTSWQPLQCNVLFPKCDGERALEIVNEVAYGS